MNDQLPSDFVWQIYLIINDDLIKNGITNQKQAEKHYLDYGKKEDRIYDFDTITKKLPKNFDWKFYLDNNIDLKFNNITTELSAAIHYIYYGQYEKRKFFDSDRYFAQCLNKYRNMGGICIVTPDIVGPVKNGGIGTACYNYAKSIQKYQPVTILYTGLNIDNANQYVKYKEYYKQLNINFLWLPAYSIQTPVFGSGELFFQHSLDIYRFLLKQNYSKIIFQDWLANGFWSVRCKKNNNDFKDTILAVMCQSCTQWQNEGMKIIPDNVLYNQKLIWAEKETISNADHVIATSNHMLNWLYDNKYREKTHNDFVLYQTYHKIKKKKYRTKKIKHLAFFGRLEKRKGLDIFIDSILSLDNDTLSKIKKISFLGKHSFVDNISSKDILEQFQKKIHIETSIENDLDHNDAIDYLIKNNCLVVIPSIFDNAPLTVIESIAYDLPLIASNVGGIPEFLDSEYLFEPNKNSLCEKLKNTLSYNQNKNTKKYNFAKNEIELKSYIMSNIDTNIIKNVKQRQSSIDICITTYNDSQYISNLLNSFNNQTMIPNTIYIVDDGSTDKKSKHILNRINNKKNKYNFNVEILNKPNGGPSSARNYAIKKCNSDYIIFFDSDNIPYCNMINKFYDAIVNSQSDVVYCAYDLLDQQDNKIGTYRPLGNYLFGGLKNNDLGDTCCIAKTEIMKKNLFIEDNNVPEDWLMALSLNINGYNISSIYEPLFLYKQHNNNRSSKINNNHYYLVQYMCKLIKNIDTDNKEKILTIFLEMLHSSNI